jgi:DNA-directed RNA polymerase specialized sigma24 family protein
VRDPSFEEFVRAQLPALGRQACALTGDARAAHELVVATLATLARWSRHTPVDELGSLAVGTLYRTYLRRGLLPRAAAGALRSLPPALGGARDGDGTPFSRAVARLPRDQRAVLVATFVAEAPDAEIAELIGRTPIAVRSLRYRGLRALRAAQGPQDTAPASAREDWTARDMWTQETVHLPTSIPVQAPPRAAVPRRPIATRERGNPKRNDPKLTDQKQSAAQKQANQPRGARVRPVTGARPVAGGRTATGARTATGGRVVPSGPAVATARARAGTGPVLNPQPSRQAAGRPTNEAKEARRVGR